jgi:hypothetical protein
VADPRGSPRKRDPKLYSDEELVAEIRKIVSEFVYRERLMQNLGLS